MGAGASKSLLPAEAGGAAGLGDLPESCVASILLHLNPTEICTLASVSRAFGAAARADLVWNSKLPENYDYLLEKARDRAPGDDDYRGVAKSSNAANNRDRLLRKKEIYALLCRPSYLDSNTKVFCLEKINGGICMSVSSKALSITGVDDRRYWNQITTDESRFNTVAYLLQTWWFEVKGEMEFCFPAGTYSLFFRFMLGRPCKRLCWRTCDASRIHGWDRKPVRFQLSTSSQQKTVTQCYLDEPGKWINFHVGDFVVDDPNVPTKVNFSMMQIDCTHTKGGLCVDSVSVYPTCCRPAEHSAI